jgi:hypothetical protein
MQRQTLRSGGGNGAGCMKDWSNAPWVDPKLGWKPRAVSELPECALIDFATKCNLRCLICPILLDEMMAAQPMVQSSM